MRTKRFTRATVTIAFLAPILLTAQGRFAWDGVFTAAQASRGKAAYERGCQSCHGAEGAGGFGITYSGTALKGQRFVQTWEDDLIGLQKYVFSPPPGSSLGQFEQKHGDSDSPRGAKDPLSETDKIDVIAYLLQLNGFAVGNQELTLAAIPTIKLQEKEPQPLPNFSLARAVGCLTKSGDDTWSVTNTKVRRARDGEPSKPADLAVAAAAPAGTDTILLMEIYPDPDTVITPSEHVGHKVQAKGIFMKDPKGDRISVNTLEMVGPTCK
jgi:S-disulfanyl-L-cysteine oxidoreductase SoxD